MYAITDKSKIGVFRFKKYHISQSYTHMCLCAWMIALTSSEFTMLNILLQNTPDAVGSAMASMNSNKLQLQMKHLFYNLMCDAW